MLHRTILTAALLGTLTLSAGCVDSITAPAKQTNDVRSQSTSQPPTICPALPGDLTGDGRVDAADVATFAQALRADLTQDGSIDESDAELLTAVVQNAPADFNRDGIVDASDIAAFARAKKTADFDGNGVVDASDVAAFGAAKAKADANQDGSVNEQDREEISRRLGEISPCA